MERIYEAARRVAWGYTTTYGNLAKELGAGPEAARDVGKAHGQESGGPDHPLPQGPGGRRGFPRRVARRPRGACSRWRAFTSIRRHRSSNPFGFKAGKRLSEEAERRPRLILQTMQKGKILGAICA